MRAVARPLLALTLATAAAAVAAAPVTFAFSGAVTSDPFGLSTAGAPISGTYTFDSAAADAVAAGQIGSFASSGPAFGFFAQVDGSSYAVPDAVTVNVANDIGVDQYGVIAQAGGLTLELFFEDGTQSAFGSDALPLLPPALAAFGWREFRLFGTDVEFLGSIDALTCVAGCNTPAPLPAPGSLLLSAAALACLAGLGGKQRRRLPTTAC